MNENAIRNVVSKVIYQLSNSHSFQRPIPIAVSARHCHLSEMDVEKLFGNEYKLTPKKDLSQPGQFAANETVTIVGSKGSIQRIRVLGPTRTDTQVEISKTDAVTLGVNPPLRESGDIVGSSPITIVGPRGSIYLKEGLIIAKNHIHMSLEDANYFGVQHGDYVEVSTHTVRSITFKNVLVRVSPNYRLEMHIDTDEANASLINTGQSGVLIRKEFEPNFKSTKVQDVGINFNGKLLTEKLVDTIDRPTIFINKSTIVTPLARDRAKYLKKRIKLIGD
ncbi:phosphate propanoyltransferase [Pseudogracilibacillus auburnensis]|uniref:Phosphate propanoyltransferase n=1 Tax=Pseudogracilibacillus auburnensis TaxID=1494959 RepID=A0A2V3W5X2_9BACI|nr:phosphate propanoyltransferase [Pseudogracilibacillus auburnensis]MBO1001668.1 phosphate propanoyltransferase [Pseudogracilibacillus auburnensis]PXW89410.1 putative phosphotransacetylase [Pseudogracilibacillus auburnensis]